MKNKYKKFFKEKKERELQHFIFWNGLGVIVLVVLLELLIAINK